MNIKTDSISFVIVCYKSVVSLKPLLLSIPKKHEVILVDNSKDEDLISFSKNYNCKLIRNEKNLGFGKACNIGAENANGEYIFFVNPDTSLGPETIDALLQAAKRYPLASAFNPKLINNFGKQIFKRRSVLLPRSNWMSKVPPKIDKKISVLSGAAIFIKKENFLKVSGFDTNIFLYHEDDDISIRLEKEVGPLMYISSAEMKHVGGSSSENNNEITALKGFYMGKSRVYSQKKHDFTFVVLRNCLWAILQLFSPEMLFLQRKRIKYISYLKGIFLESLNNQNKIIN